MDAELQQGINAVKAGNKQLALDFLMRATQVPEAAEMAWLWMTSVVNDDAERLYCIERVLRINPQNANAQKGATILRQKGIMPAMPDFQVNEPGSNPAATAAPAPTVYATSQASSITTSPFVQSQQSAYGSQNKPAFPEIGNSPTPAATNNWSQYDRSGLFEFAIGELAHGKSLKNVENLLIQRGVSADDAKLLAKEGKSIVKKGRRQVHQKRMAGGLAIAIVGIIITVLTFMFSDTLGGKAVIFYGLILVGGFNFIVGLVGWVSNL